MLDRDSLPRQGRIESARPTHLNQDQGDGRMGQDHGKFREPSRLPPFAPFSPSFRKSIWQCYSELAGGGKNTLASPLEVNVFCPYLCTTPQGRDGPTATETREGKGKQSCTIAGHADRREKGLENYLKKDFAVSEKVPTFAVPTKGNSEGRDVRSERNDTSTPLKRRRYTAEARCPGAISSLNDHVAQRPVREYGS